MTLLSFLTIHQCHSVGTGIMTTVQNRPAQLRKLKGRNWST